MMNCGSCAENSASSLIKATYVRFVRCSYRPTRSLEGTPVSNLLPVFMTTPCKGFCTTPTDVSSKLTMRSSFLVARASAS